MGFFDDPIPEEAAHAHALLLPMRRDRRLGDEAYTALVEAASHYLPLNPHDAEMRGPWDRFVGRPATTEGCAHTTLACRAGGKRLRHALRVVRYGGTGTQHFGGRAQGAAGLGAR